MTRPRVDGLSGRLFLTVREVADLLRLDERSVRRAVERDEIPAVRIGNSIRIPTAAFRDMAGLPSEDGDGPTPASAAPSISDPDSHREIREPHHAPLRAS